MNSFYPSKYGFYCVSDRFRTYIQQERVDYSLKHHSSQNLYTHLTASEVNPNTVRNIQEIFVPRRMKSKNTSTTVLTSYSIFPISLFTKFINDFLFLLKKRESTMWFIWIVFCIAKIYRIFNFSFSQRRSSCLN